MILDQVYRQRFSEVERRKELWTILTQRFFQQYVDKEHDIVLDVPCGYAEFINAVECKKKYAADINEDVKQYVSKDVVFLLDSSTKLSLPKASVTKIFVSNFFEHLSHDDIEKTIREFTRVLKPGGQVLILQPNIRFVGKDYWMFFDHITPIDDRALEEAFVALGFDLKLRILKFMPFTTRSRYPAKAAFVKLYLSLPILWRIFGKQTFMIFEKK
ncbi:MAG TPA: class I SAM-dependent methyltransferase [Bacillota bacterium]|nr:class I SAM-dependent methyltransferase [Bacillota bacterium]